MQLKPDHVFANPAEKRGSGPRSAAPAGMRVAELFGATPAVRFAVACAIAYLFSGHSGIYTAHRTDLPKKSTG